MEKHVRTAARPATRISEDRIDAALFHQMRERLDEELNTTELLQESVEDLQRAVDEIGWVPVGSSTPQGLRLSTILRASDVMRAMVAGNPMIKKGIRARVGFVWGEGIHYTVEGGKSQQGKTPPAMQKIIDANDDLIFADAAYEELESAAATDGNLFFVIDKRGQRIFRMPLLQVANWTLDPQDGETIQFILRRWSIQTIDDATGQIFSQFQQAWYPTVEYLEDGGVLPGAIGQYPVEQNMAINVVQVNKQLGWIWGVPDLMPVLFWAQAYKEFLSSQYSLVRSLARFAFKVTDTRPKGQGAKSAAVKLAQPIGGSSESGATSTLPGGMDLSAINKSGANVDFAAGKPLATMVAAGLEIPLSAMLAEDAGSSDALLDATTAKAMQARQRLWADAFEDMFRYMGIPKPRVIFPPIQSAPVHRVVQAIITAAASGVLYPDEVRGLIVKAMLDYGIEPKPGLPKPGEWSDYANPAQQHPATPPIPTPDPTATGAAGSKSPAGPTFDGDHEQRPSQGPSS